MRAGLHGSGVLWALTTGYFANWHPLTWLSYMLDASLWGLDPRGYHATNLVLHAVNAALCYLWLRRATNAHVPSLLAAALFAVHPTRIESVAWVAERKDVLSAAFGFAALIAYTEWTRRPTPRLQAAALGAFAAGLMAKPMLVTLPFLLLLLDHWPLARAQPDAEAPRKRDVWLRLVLEKWPWFLLALLSCWITLEVQEAGGAVKMRGLVERIELVLLAYAGYLRRLVWPVDLAVFYPLPSEPPSPALVMGAALLLAVLTALALLLGRRRPYLAVGWFAFVGMIFPVSGIVAIGHHALADRYTYLPFIGLFVALAWWAHESVPRRTLWLGAAIVIAVLGVQTRRELAYWRNSETLFRRTIEVTHQNFYAHQLLGRAYNESGRWLEAVPHLQEAVRLRTPDFWRAHLSLSRAYLALGRYEEAAALMEEMLQEFPDDPSASINLAYCRLAQGRLDEAADRVARASPHALGDAELQHQLGLLWIVLGDWPRGQRGLSRAARIEPDRANYRSFAEGALLLHTDPATRDPRAEPLRRQLLDMHRIAAHSAEQRGRHDAARGLRDRARLLDAAP